MANDKQARLARTDEAARIVGKMSLEEKVELMSGKVELDELMSFTRAPDAERRYNSYPYAAGAPASPCPWPGARPSIRSWKSA
jgi:beta-glucosidase